MDSLQSIKPIFFRYTWQFREFYTDNISSISCMAFSIEEARNEIFSTLKQIENIADEKNKVDEEINALYRIRRTQSNEESECTLDKILKLTQSLEKKYHQANDYTGHNGIRINNYHSDLKVIYYQKYTNEEITSTLATLISTIEPKIEYARFVTFT